MKITVEQLRIQTKALWPFFKNVYFFDKEYWLPSKNKIEQLVLQDKTNAIQFIPKLNECNNFALSLYAAIQNVRVWEALTGKIPRTEWLPYPFGRIMGTVFRGMAYNHAVNVCFCKEGIYLIEPQDDRMWLASADKDKPYFLEV